MPEKGLQRKEKLKRCRRTPQIKNPEPIDVRRYWSISTLVSIAIIIPAVYAPRTISMPSSLASETAARRIKIESRTGKTEELPIQRAIMRDSLSERRLLAKEIAPIASARKTMLNRV